MIATEGGKTIIKITDRQIIDAKLYPGVGASNPISRVDLFPPAEFMQGHASVYLIQAPAGYGKSTLMSSIYEWMESDTTCCVWLSLDTDDNDPARLLDYLITGIARVCPGLLKESLPQLDDGFSSVKSQLEALAFDLGNLDQRLVIFLDDIHSVDAEQACELIDWLLQFTPANCQFVLGSREEPKLHLSTLRIRRKLQEIDIAALAFRLAQTQQFFANRVTPLLAEEDVLALHNRTEGWPAGLELAVLALENEEDRSALIKSFAGSDKAVVDYLGDVLLSQYDDDSRRFIYQISFFNRINAKLAAHVTQLNDAARRLKDMRSRGMFLIPLDRNGEWYRFHHLAGQYLQSSCLLENPEIASTALLAGAKWLYQQDHIEEAINCAIRNESWEIASQWIDEHGTLFNSQKGYLTTVLNWMRVLPQEWINKHPSIRRNYSFAVVFFSHRRELAVQNNLMREHRALLAQAEQPDQAAIDELDCTMEHIEITQSALSDEGERSLELGLRWLEKWPNAEIHQRGDIWNIIGYGYKTLGDIEKGLEAADEAQRIGEENELYFNVLWSYVLRGLLHLKSGDYRAAQRSAEAGLAMVNEKMSGNRTNAALVHAILGFVAYHFGEYDAVVRHVNANCDAIDQYSQADFLILKYLTQARLLFFQNDAEGAWECLKQGQSVGEMNKLPRVVLSLAAEECIWHCRYGQLDDARRVAAQHDISVDLENIDELDPILIDKSLRTGSRILAHEQPGRAAEKLISAIEYCERRAYLHRLAELLLVQAGAYWRDGNTAAANSALLRALDIGSERDYFQLFIDDVSEIGEILRDLNLPKDVSPATKALHKRLVAALASSPASGAERAGNEPVEKLSKREVQILKRLESDLSNREIAKAIFVTEGTLKWHLHNIYGKLGVKNRPGALLKARELGYL